MTELIHNGIFIEEKHNVAIELPNFSVNAFIAEVDGYRIISPFLTNVPDEFLRESNFLTEAQIKTYYANERERHLELIKSEIDKRLALT